MSAAWTEPDYYWEMTIAAVRDNCRETCGINDVKGVNVQLICTVTVLPIRLLACSMESDDDIAEDWVSDVNCAI